MASSSNEGSVNNNQATSSNVVSDPSKNVNVLSLTKLAYYACNQQDKYWYDNMPTLPKVEIGVCCARIINMGRSDFYSSEVVLDAITTNHLPCLKIALKQGLHLPVGSIQYAAATGNIHMIDFIIEQGLPWSYTRCTKKDFDAIRRHLDLLRYVHKDTCKLAHDWIKNSVHYGLLELLDQAHSPSCFWRKDSSMLALSQRKELGLVKVQLPCTGRFMWTTTEFLHPSIGDSISDSNDSSTNEPHSSDKRRKLQYNPDINLINAIRYCMDYIQKNEPILRYNKKGNGLKGITRV